MNTQTKPKIELRKVKVLKSLSEETPCYTADVWVDGVFFCHASNHGHGGCDMQHASSGANAANFNDCLQALNERIKETYEPHAFKAGDEMMSIDMDLELLCHIALDDIETEKALKRNLAKKILFRKADGKVYQMTVPAHARAETIEFLKRKPDVNLVLNEMPFAEALAIYKAA